MSKNITFVSNTDILNAKGGWDGLGFNIFKLLTLSNKVELVDKISPEVPLMMRFCNKIIKILGFKINFFFFSTTRLLRISVLCENRINSNTDLIVFHGSTPWVHYKPEKDYIVILDCSFNTYIDVYHNKKEYKFTDIVRIEELERQFLSNAKSVFFTSKYALNETLVNYSLQIEKLFIISQGPSIDLNEVEYSKKHKQFLFIATDFIGKGGRVIYTAFCKFCEYNNDFSLIIVGEKPSATILKNPKVKYLGYLDKSNKNGLEVLKNLYAQSYCLLMLSNRDIAPLAIVEAGYSYCPTIALNSTAIPEMIIHEKTGYLVNQKDELLLLEKMIRISNLSLKDYKDICINVQLKMVSEYNWEISKGQLNSSL